jgi:streptogramin lyase
MKVDNDSVGDRSLSPPHSTASHSLRSWMFKSRHLAVTVGLVALLSSLLVVSPVAAKTKQAKFSGAAPGSVTCSVEAKIKFSPPLTESGGGTGPTSVKARLSGCATSDGTVSIIKGKASGSFARSPYSCATLSTTGASVRLTIRWRGSYGGRGAKFTSTTVSGTNASGSFAGNATFTLPVPSSLRASCAAKKGAKKVTVTGTTTLGNHVATTFSNGDITPQAIVSDPDGYLWFTNNFDTLDRITTAGVIDPPFPGTHAGDIDAPTSITLGPDGNLWFTNEGNNSIGRITPTGSSTHYANSSISDPAGITVGPDGNLWYGNQGTNTIGRITTAGVIKAPFSSTHSGDIDIPTSITEGPDGNMWFTNLGDSIGRITPTGTTTHFDNATTYRPTDITSGPNGALWFTNSVNASIGDTDSIDEITTGGVITHEYSTGSGLDPSSITSGPDGNLWFTNGDGGADEGVGRVTPTGVVTYGYDGSGANEITVGPDRNVWFTESDAMGRIKP